MTTIELWEEASGDAPLSEIFDETDRLLVDASIRLAGRLGTEALVVSVDLYRALLLLAKAIRHSHAAIELTEEAVGRLVEEHWTLRDDRGQFEPAGDPIAASAVIEAMTGADRRLLGVEPMESDVVDPNGSPLVLSTAGGEARYVTTRRFASSECAISNRLLASARDATSITAEGAVLPTAHDLVGFADPDRLNEGVVAFIERAMTRSVSVLTGGPGTGKTTAIATLLRSLGLWARSQDRQLRIALCAPTAKAAVRTREALDGAFGPNGLDEFADELAIDDRSGSVHRLLGIRPDRSVSTVELRCDLVIVDEVSMLEMTLLDQLLGCAGASHVVLVGDPDQLASVEVGAVLRDLVDAGEADSAPLSALVTRLVRSFRSNDAIVDLATAINAGDLGAVRAALARHPGALLRSATPEGEVSSVIDHALEVRALAEAGEVHAALECLGRQVVLCANREGDHSVAWWRTKVDDALRRSRGAERSPGRFEVGTPIMVLKNEQSPTRPLPDRLSNGDVGVVCATDSGPEVYFLPVSNTPRHRPVRVIDQATPAWSFTIHKSQGSEYDKVIVSLPTTKNRILSRELIYTAVTRARSEVVIIGSDEVFAAALGTSVDRVSGLTERIAVRASK